MHTSMRRGISAIIVLVLALAVSGLLAQSASNSGTIYGTVTDPTGAIVPGAAISIENPVSGLSLSLIHISAAVGRGPRKSR